jgi:hypothetical protein
VKNRCQYVGRIGLDCILGDWKGYEIREFAWGDAADIGGASESLGAVQRTHA